MAHEEYPYREPLTDAERSRWNLHPNIRQNRAARLAESLGQYKLYRAGMFAAGFQNPFAAVFKVTSRCTLDCSHCPWHDNRNQDLSTERWLGIIDEVHELGALTIVFEGGEPVLRQDLQQLILYARQQKKMDTIVITNGTLPLKGLTPDNFWFSIEGTEALHDQIRGPGSYGKMLPQLAHCKEQGFHALAALTLSSTNFQAIEEIIESIAPLVSAIFVNFIYPYKGTRDQAIPQQALHPLSRRLIALKKQYPQIVNSREGLRIVGRGEGIRCHPWWNIHVRHDGEMVHDCVIRQYERYDCSICYLACYNETYLGTRLNPSSLMSYRRFRGR